MTASPPHFQYTPSQDESFSLRHMVGLLKRESVLLLAVAVFVWVWIGIYLLLGYQPKYASEATVLIKDAVSRERYVQPDLLPGSATSTASPVLNAMSLLKSKRVEQALWVFLSQKHPETLQKLKIQTAEEWSDFFDGGKHLITSKNDPGTDVISIKLKWESPDIAQAGLNAVLDGFQEASLELNRAEQKSRSQYIDNQTQAIDKKLKLLRTQKAHYKSKSRIANLTRESEKLADAGIELANQLNQFEAQAVGKEQAFERYQSMLGFSPEEALRATGLGGNQNLSKLYDKLYEQTQYFAQLKATLTDKNPKVLEAKSVLNQIESNIKRELIRSSGWQSNKTISISDVTRSKAINEMVEAHAESIRLRSEQVILKDRLDEVQSKIQTLPNVEETLSKMDDEEKTLSAAIYSLRQKELDARIKQAETVSNVFVMNHPSHPGSQAFPNSKHIIFIGFLAGLVLGLAAVILKSAWLEEGLVSDPDHVVAVNSAQNAPPMPEAEATPVDSFRPPVPAADLVTSVVQSVLKEKELSSESVPSAPSQSSVVSQPKTGLSQRLLKGLHPEDHELL
jgi:uncharacterized protein involved in exopolysaccharide biosynthesis